MLVKDTSIFLSLYYDFDSRMGVLYPEEASTVYFPAVF